jgi:hypothetical protein
VLGFFFGVSRVRVCFGVSSVRVFFFGVSRVRVCFGVSRARFYLFIYVSRVFVNNKQNREEAFLCSSETRRARRIRRGPVAPCVVRP